MQENYTILQDLKSNNQAHAVCRSQMNIFIHLQLLIIKVANVQIICVCLNRSESNKLHNESMKPVLCNIKNVKRCTHSKLKHKRNIWNLYIIQYKCKT